MDSEIAEAQEKSTYPNVVSREVLKISGLFFLLFFSFIAAQNFETTINGEDGSIVLSILYITFAVCSLFSGLVVKQIGLLMGFVLAGVCFSCFVISNVSTLP